METARPSLKRMGKVIHLTASHILSSRSTPATACHLSPCFDFSSSQERTRQQAQEAGKLVTLSGDMQVPPRVGDSRRQGGLNELRRATVSPKQKKVAR
jgi:hypothetical protein